MAECDSKWVETVRFARINRGEFDFKNVWQKDDGIEAIELMALAITDEYRVHRTLVNGDLKFTAPLKWLKPICYNAILTCLHHELFDVLEARIEKYGRLVRGPAADRSVFMMGLVGIFAHDKPQVTFKGQKKELTTTLTSPKERERMAVEMRWAFRHYISPSELVQFNRNFPLHKAADKLPNDYIIPELYESVIERRSNDEAFRGEVEQERGSYPQAIEEAVQVRLEERDLARRRKSKLPDIEWDR